MPDNNDPAWLPELAEAMVRVAGYDPPSSGPIQAGYTYLGQFISHDVVPPTSRTGHPRPVTPALDLGSVYGGANGAQPRLDARGRFLLGAGGHDLARDAAGRADIPEPRNDENQVIAQLHVLWQRLHNALLDGGLAEDLAGARALVVQAFQLIVVEDFLPQIVTPAVYEACFVEGRHYMGYADGPLPAEFTHAGFRFGHSMVRPDYRLNDRASLLLEELMQPGRAIPADRAIDWSRFFGSDPLRAQQAGRIDSFVTPAMDRIPDPGLIAGLIHIAQANLLAGLKAGLPPGLTLAAYVLQGLEGRTAPPAGIGLVPLGSQRTSGLGMRFDVLPLWPYLLLEAEVQQFGRRLGALGSLVVAEALHASIRQSTWPILHDGVHDCERTLAALGRLGESLRRAARANRAAGAATRRIRMEDLLSVIRQLEEACHQPTN